MDQLLCILSVLGKPPDPKSLKWVSDYHARQYLDLQSRNFLVFSKPQWSQYLAHTGSVTSLDHKHAFDLMEKMLKFCPHDRIGLDEALAHPFFLGQRSALKDVPKHGPMHRLLTTLTEVETFLEIYDREDASKDERDRFKGELLSRVRSLVWKEYQDQEKKELVSVSQVG
jgi:serine/threonine protein kinase